MLVFILFSFGHAQTCAPLLFSLQAQHLAPVSPPKSKAELTDFQKDCRSKLVRDLFHSPQQSEDALAVPLSA